MKDVIAITVSTNYDDILNIVLPCNQPFLKKWYIVTHALDKTTIEVIKKYDFANVELVFFDFYRNTVYNKTTFNKGGAIQYAQTLVDAEVQGETTANDTLVLLLDSDILLPNNFNEYIKNTNIQDHTIYGVNYRLHYFTKEHFDNDIVDLTDRTNVDYILGFFQLYKYHQTYKYFQSRDCSKCDLLFSQLFVKRDIIENFAVKHLGKQSVHWSGRNKEIDDFTD